MRVRRCAHRPPSATHVELPADCVRELLVARVRAGVDLKEANRLDPKSKEVREAFASIKAAEAA